MTSEDASKIRDVDWVYEEFGQRIRIFRIQAGLRQQELAGMVGLSRASITNIESGRQRFPFHLVYQLAQALRVSPNELVVTANQLPSIPEDVLKDVKKPEYQEWVRRIVAKGSQRSSDKEEPVANTSA